MNPASAFLVRARATWPGTCVSTTGGVGRQAEGPGVAPRQWAYSTSFLCLPSPCLVMSAGPLLETQILGMGEEGSSSPQAPATPPATALLGLPSVTKFKCFHP